jgi:PDZ domain-containing secreted protein
MDGKRRTLFLFVGLFLIVALLVGGAVTAAYAYQALAGRNLIQEETTAANTTLPADDAATAQDDDSGQTLSEQGVLITHVEAGSPAAEAGLKRGSIILAVDGEEVNNPRELHQAINGHEAGDTVTLTTLVCDAPSDIEVTLASAGPYLGIGIDSPFGGPGMPGLGTGEVPFGSIPGEGGGFGGEHFFPMPGVGPNVRFPAVVMEVIADSPAAEAGLQPGDLITAIDGEPVDAAGKVSRLIGSKAPGDTVELTVERNDEMLTLTVTLTEHPDDAERGFLGIQLGSAIREFEIEPAPFPGVQS